MLQTDKILYEYDLKFSQQVIKNEELNEEIGKIKDGIGSLKNKNDEEEKEQKKEDAWYGMSLKLTLAAWTTETTLWYATGCISKAVYIKLLILTPVIAPYLACLLI